MLKRSPRSRFTTGIIVAASVLAVYISIDALVTLRSLTQNYGSRQTYLQITRAVNQGELLTRNDFSEHVMFSSDAPKGALRKSDNPVSMFVKYSIGPGTILTKSMVATNAISSIDNENRIIFVPTKDILTSSISDTTDLLSVSADGYGSEYLARNATILFDLSSEANNLETEHGYFVEVSQEEAEEIVEALSLGDVRFALTTKNH